MSFRILSIALNMVTKRFVIKSRTSLVHSKVGNHMENLGALFEERLRYSSLEVKRGTGLTTNYLFCCFDSTEKGVIPKYGNVVQYERKHQRCKLMLRRLSKDHTTVCRKQFLKINLSIN